MESKQLLVLCGGKSAEHNISLVSGWNLLNKLNNSNIETSLIAIDEKGNWFYQSIEEFLNQEPNPKTIHIPNKDQPIFIQAGNSDESFYLPKSKTFLPSFDVVFPLLHGPNGEDGSMQGLLKHIQIPFIGPGVLGSAVCMDKDVAKRLFQQANIPTSNFVTLYQNQDIPSYHEVEKQLGSPMFIKPVNMGSSVGINKVRNEQEYREAVKEAFEYDSKIIIEEFIEGIEVECAVLGNSELQVSRPGTYVHQDDFFDFETKYLKGKEVVMQIPAKALSETQQKEVMELSEKAYRSLACSGLARVDTFFTKDGRFLVNEINTLPGFTQNSMYPILMEDKGIPYVELVNLLCDLAISKFKENN